MRTLLLLATLVALASPFARASAQSDVIRGRIVGPDSRPIERATVTVTSLRGNLSRVARTDRDGRYTISFPGDDGDYFVSVAALGFAARRFEVKRTIDQEIIVGNARLAVAAQQLDVMRVDATRQRVSRTELPLDVSGSDRATNNSANGADPFADLAALAASLPGVQLIPSADGPSGFSVLGLTADQNVMTLNGMTFGGSTLPRDANVSTSVVTTPYDVSRGNFSGGMLALRTEPASNYITRIGGVNFDSPTLQWTDRAARATGQQYGNVSVGGRLSGPIQFDRSSFNLAYQAGRRSADYQTLLNTDAVGLQAAGIAADSARRLAALLQRAGVPTSVAGLPRSRFNDNASLFGTFDFMPSASSGQALNVTVNGAWNRSDPAFGDPTQLPTRSGTRQNWYAGAQARYSTYFGSGILSETSLGLTEQRNDGSPFLDAPGAMVRVSSAFADGTSGIQGVSFGGNADLASRQTTGTQQVANQLSWFSFDNKHRLKLTTELRRDASAQDLTPNRRGTYGYNSLGDLEANRPSAFMRTLGSQARDASGYVAAASLGDSYRPTDRLQLQYGLRADANRFDATPAYNAAIARQFDARNDRLPNRLYLSPRVGFSYAYGSTPRATAFDGAVRDPRATIRGGIGVFQSTPTSAQLGTVLDNTGLANGSSQLVCIGAAVPSPDWASYANGGASPTQCADGTSGSAFANSAPNVALFARDYRSPRSVRSNVQWSGLALDNRIALSVDLTYSLNLAQASVSDLNFAPSTQFSLGDDGRPVYARPQAIDAATGTIGAGEGRVDRAFARVTELRSDMRSDARQLTLQLRPASFDATLSWGLSYVYSQARERYRGFTSTGGNPLDVAWSRSPFDSRHQIVYTFTYNALDVVRLNWYGSLRSGTPYTPLIASDINGDGFANDRAFIADPSSATDATLAAGMRSLLNGASSSVRGCLESQLGSIAARMSCQGPWTTTSNLTLSLNPLRVRMPQRATLSFQLSNPIAAADLALHGERGVRGWGQQFTPTTQLLFVRGFDATTRRYRYEVNQRFGSTAVAQNALRTPIALTAMVRVDVGPTRERQALTEMLDRGRTLPGQKLPEQIIKARYGTIGIVNPMAELLRQSDTLALSPMQGDSIAQMNRRYMMRVDSIWAPVAKFLAALPDRYEQGEAYARYRAAREANVDALSAFAPALRRLLTADQWRRVPPSITSYTNVRYLASIRSGTAGSDLGTLMNGMPLPAGASNPAAAAIMMHGGTP